MTTYGGRNKFRGGYCSPDDIQHNMRMLSDLSEAIGNPFMEGGPSWKYQQTDGNGDPIYDTDGNALWHEEPLITAGGLARFKLDVSITGAGPWKAWLISGDLGHTEDTEQFIYVTDPLGRYGNIPAGTMGYAQSIQGGWEILSMGRPGETASSTLTDGMVRIRDTCEDLKSLADWFDVTDSEAPEESPAGYQPAAIKQDPSNCEGKIHVHVPSQGYTPPEDDGEPKEGDIILKFDQENNQYWFPKEVLDGVDRKVAVTGADATSAELETKSGGDTNNSSMHKVVYEVTGGGEAGQRLRGEVPFTTPILVGMTTSTSDVGCPTTIDVQIIDPPPGPDEEPTVLEGVKIVTEKPAKANHCVLVTQGGPNSGGVGAPSMDWWVIWYACDEMGSGGSS